MFGSDATNWLISSAFSMHAGLSSAWRATLCPGTQSSENAFKKLNKIEFFQKWRMYPQILRGSYSVSRTKQKICRQRRVSCATKMEPSN